MLTVLALDLGVILHAAVITGTSSTPVLLETGAVEWRGPGDTEAVIAFLEEIIGRYQISHENAPGARGGCLSTPEGVSEAPTWQRVRNSAPVVIAVEETFSAGRSLPGRRDIGRLHEHQGAYLEGVFRGRVQVVRVPPVNDQEAAVAWTVFGRPAAAKGPHHKDCCGVGLKCLIRQEDAKRQARIAQEVGASG